MTAGVLRLVGEALIDLALLPGRIVLAFVLSGRRRRDITRLLTAAARGPESGSDHHAA